MTTLISEVKVNDMANQEHLDLLKQGIEDWNEWRYEHPNIVADLSEAHLVGADLQRADLRNANLQNADLRKANLSGSHLSEANLSKTHFRGAELHETVFYKANLSGADFQEAVLSNANLSGANLNGASLYRAILSNATLSNATLSNATLNSADASRADLSDAHLNSTNLLWTRFDWANLRGTDLVGADLYGASLYESDLSGADLSDANLSGANLSGANLSGADLTGCRIYATSAWNVTLEKTVQTGLIITRKGEPNVTVDDLEIAQFIYLLLNHKKLRNVLNAVTAKGVLLLGRFGGGGLEVLHALAAKLREEKYLPIIFDFERPTDRNYTETVKTLAGLARFIIADLSGPSVPQELYATVPHFKIPFVPILETGRKPFAMAVDLLEYPWVIRPPVTFASTEELLSLVPSKIIAPAEEKHQARQQLLDELFRSS